MSRDEVRIKAAYRSILQLDLIGNWYGGSESDDKLIRRFEISDGDLDLETNLLTRLRRMTTGRADRVGHKVIIRIEYVLPILRGISDLCSLLRP